MAGESATLTETSAAAPPKTSVSFQPIVTAPRLPSPGRPAATTAFTSSVPLGDRATTPVGSAAVRSAAVRVPLLPWGSRNVSAAEGLNVKWSSAAETAMLVPGWAGSGADSPRPAAAVTPAPNEAGVAVSKRNENALASLTVKAKLRLRRAATVALADAFRPSAAVFAPKTIKGDDAPVAEKAIWNVNECADVSAVAVAVVAVWSVTPATVTLVVPFS